MAKLYSFEDIVKILVDRGYHSVRWKGSHLVMQKGQDTLHVPRKKTMPRKFVSKIFKKFGIKNM